MRKSCASIASQIANGVAVGLMVVASMPQIVMNAFGLGENPAATTMESHARSSPHRPRVHLSVVAGLVITGALVVYMTTIHMGSLSSEEAALLSKAPNSNASRSSPPRNSSLNVNSSAQSAPDYTDINRRDDFNVSANISIPVASPQPVETIAASPQPAETIAASPQPAETIAASPQPAETIAASPQPAETIAASPQPADAIAAIVYFQNMSETWHTMGDKELLKKASSTMAPLRVGASSASKLAYMFMARGVLPLAPLWERYFRGHAQLYSIYIHAHPDYVPSLDPSSPFFRRFIPSQVVQWGKLSVYQAERRLLGNALLDATNEWFLLLSESCIPIFNFPETYDYFNLSRSTSFIESYPDITRRLYRQNHEAMSPEITFRNFRKGSQWFQITRDLAVFAARDSKEYTKFEKYFCQAHPTCYIDEHCLPTLAWIESPRKLAFRTLTYFDFRGKGAHPRKFAERDTDANLILGFRKGHNCTFNGQASSKCHLFVRKFHPDALKNLLDLAGPVMGIP